MLIVDRQALLREFLAALDEQPEFVAALEAKLAAKRTADGARRYESYQQRAKRTGVGSSTIRRAKDEGRLEYMNVGRRVLIPIDAEIVPKSGNTALSRAEARLGLTPPTGKGRR